MTFISEALLGTLEYVIVCTRNFKTCHFAYWGGTKPCRFCHCICDFLCHCPSFNPSFCHFLLFVLSCVAVSSHVAWFPGYDLLCDCAMQSLCPHDFVTLKWPAHLVPEFSVAQWLSDWCLEGHGFNSHPELWNFFWVLYSTHSILPIYYLLLREFLHDCVMLQFIHLFIFLHNAVVQCGHSVSLLITSAYF